MSADCTQGYSLLNSCRKVPKSKISVPLLPQDKIGSLDDLALADLLRTDLLPEIEDVSSDSGGGGGCWPGIGTIMGWDQQQQVEPVAATTTGLQFLRSAECQHQQLQQQQQQQQDLLDLNCGGRGEVFSDIEVSEAVDRSLAKLVSAE